ncbi:MAG TPA: hypothetical protein VGE41_00290 [Verrucomicrobiae bacterium]
MKHLLVALLSITVWFASSPVSYPGPNNSPWFSHALVGMEIGPTGAQFGHSDSNDTRYCARFDGAGIVRHAGRAGAEYVVIWARDGDYAYYQSKILPKAPGLGARDPLREAVAEARKQIIPLLAYCVAQQDGHFLRAHPEFALVTATGERRGRFCYNSGYLEAMKQIVAEQLAYGIDGFHLDMLDQGFNPPYGCWCATCQQLFQKEYGRPMPKGATWDAGWDRMLEFRYRTSERFEKELCRHIKGINPNASVDYNYHGNPPFSFEVGQRPVQHAVNGDFVTGETGVWGFSALTVGLNAAFYRGTTPGIPFQVAMQRGVRMYHDQTTRPLNDLRWELYTLLAHGAFVTLVDKTGFDGGLDESAYDQIGKLFHEAQTKRSQFGGEPLREVGIYYSSRTRDWYGREKPAGYFQSFLGAHKAMVYEHIPWAVVLDENCTANRLREFPVLLLPNAAILSSNEVALFEAFVRDGGKLLITGLSGSLGWRGEPNSVSPLELLIGAKLKGRLESLDNWTRFSAGELAKLGLSEARADNPFLVEGPALLYEPTSGQPLGQLLKPFRTTRQLEGKEGTEWPMSADKSMGPAVLLNHLGHGAVLTLACSPDSATGGEHHIIEARKLLAHGVRLLNPKPILQINAPINVESVVAHDAAHRAYRVHLLGYFAPPQTLPEKNRPFVMPALIEDTPLYRASLELREAARSVRALNGKTEIKRQGNRFDLLVSDLHEVIEIKY